MNRVSKVLAEPQLIISVMGPHAGEASDRIFERKIKDVGAVGWTLWVIRSQKARPDAVRNMCSGNGPAYVLFVEPSAPGGAQPTSHARAAAAYSPDRVKWLTLPAALGPVTGKMDAGAYALCFDELELCQTDVSIDLWNYCESEAPHGPVRTKIGCSTVCARRRDTSGAPGRMKSHDRKVIAWGRLHRPWAVWLR